MKIFLFLLLFSPSLVFADFTSCDHKVAMTEELLQKVIKHRESAFSVCLDCLGSNCSLKNWNQNQIQNEAICKRLFCTPKKVTSGYEIPASTPRGKTNFTYTYSISVDGKILDINILNVEGVFNKKDSKKFLKALTRKTEYEPLIHQGNEYSITDLTSSMSLNMLFRDE